MKASVGILLTGALLIAPVPLLSEAVGQEKNGAAGQEQNSEWEFHGEVEAGWREFIKRPPSGYGFGPGGVPLTAKQTESRAKFEQYGEIKPGIFLDHLYWGLAKKDGGFVADFWASNPGFNNQNYLLQLSKPGNSYLTLEWDETPHLYSTSAKTLYDNSNPTVLTIPDAIQGPGLTAAVANANVRPIELSVQRDTTKVAYRYTPDPAWDFKANYSHERKTGTRGFGTAINGNTSSIEILEPVATTTQNFDASGQYSGTSLWGKRWTANLQYAGSIFENDYDSITFDNPFRLLAPAGNNQANLGRVSLPPDNYAHRVTYTTGVDLPFDSRYMGTVAYSTMRQNQAFMPSTINPFIAPTVSALPAASLNGRIDTLLFNNVLTTRLSKDLTSTLRYRYYDLNNQTPSLLFLDYVNSDGTRVIQDRRNLPAQYKRENAGADLNWRPRNWMKTGISYAWERYDRDRRETDITDEHSGKVFMDANPWDWVHLRSSFLLAQRRYNEYDALNNVGIPSYPNTVIPGSSFLQNPLLRKFDMANRDRSKADFLAEFVTPIKSLIVTPSFGWRHDKFEDNSATSGTLGLKQDKYWNAGVELTYAYNSSATFMVSYLLEKTNRTMVNREGGIPATAASNWGSEIDDTVHTIVSSMNMALIPNSLDLKLGYTYSQSKDVTNTYALGTGNITSTPPFPDVKNNFQRFDAEARYKLEQDLVRRLGWTGDVTAKLRYVYEHNRMTNWAIDNMTPIMTGANASLFLASINPNYSAQLIAMSLAAKW